MDLILRNIKWLGCVHCVTNSKTLQNDQLRGKFKFLMNTLHKKNFKRFKLWVSSFSDEIGMALHFVFIGFLRYLLRSTTWTTYWKHFTRCWAFATIPWMGMVITTRIVSNKLGRSVYYHSINTFVMNSNSTKPPWFKSSDGQWESTEECRRKQNANWQYSDQQYLTACRKPYAGNEEATVKSRKFGKSETFSKNFHDWNQKIKNCHFVSKYLFADIRALLAFIKQRHPSCFRKVTFIAMIEPTLKNKSQLCKRQKRLEKLQQLLDEQEVQLKNIKDSMAYCGNETLDSAKYDTVFAKVLRLYSRIRRIKSIN